MRKLLLSHNICRQILALSSPVPNNWIPSLHSGKPACAELAGNSSSNHGTNTTGGALHGCTFPNHNCYFFPEADTNWRLLRFVAQCRAYLLHAVCLCACVLVRVCPSVSCVSCMQVCNLSTCIRLVYAWVHLQVYQYPCWNFHARPT
jgi:hypothetical protein